MNAEGEWHFNSNWGDGQVAIEDDKYRLIARMGTFPPGGLYADTLYDGNPYQWSSVYNITTPPKAIPSNPEGISRQNVDTHIWIRNRNTDVYTSIFSAHPGARPTGSLGLVTVFQRATSTNPTWDPADWTTYGNTILFQQDPAAPWEQAYISIPAAGAEPEWWHGGTSEPSIVYDSEGDQFILFYVGKGQDLTAPAQFGTTLRYRIGRAVCPADIFDTEPIFTRDPAASATSWVFDPKEHGANGSYSETNGTAFWGTAQSVLQQHVSINPVDGVYHLVALGKKPNTGQGVENSSSGIGHWYSLDKGLTWTADVNNPLVTWSTMDFSENGIANKLNSPHLMWDEKLGKVYLGFWANDNGVTGVEPGANPLGNKLYFAEADFANSPAAPTPSIDSGLRRRVQNILKNLGVSATLIQHTQRSFNAGSATATRTENSTAVRASPPVPFRKGYLGGDIVISGTGRTLLSDRGLVYRPSRGDKIVFGSATWEVVGVTEMKHLRSTIAWELRIKR